MFFSISMSPSVVPGRVVGHGRDSVRMISVVAVGAGVYGEMSKLVASPAETLK